MLAVYKPRKKSFVIISQKPLLLLKTVMSLHARLMLSLQHNPNTLYHELMNTDPDSEMKRRGKYLMEKYFRKNKDRRPSQTSIDDVWRFSLAKEKVHEESSAGRILYMNVSTAYPTSDEFQFNVTWLIHVKLRGGLTEIDQSQWKLKLTSSSKQRCNVVIKAKSGEVFNGGAENTEVFFEIHSRVPPRPSRIAHLLLDMLAKTGYRNCDVPYLTEMKLSVRRTYSAGCTGHLADGDVVLIQYAPLRGPFFIMESLTNYLEEVFKQYFAELLRIPYIATHDERRFYRKQPDSEIYGGSCPCDRPQCSGGRLFLFSPICDDNM